MNSKSRACVRRHDPNLNTHLKVIKMRKVLYRLVRSSGNRKLGASVFKTYASKNSCPNTCPFKGNGCFGENFPQDMAWNKVEQVGVDLPQLIDEIQSLPMRSKLRINVVGDYANPLEDIPKFSAVVARKQLDVLNYTHHKPTPEVVAVAKAASYVVNFSGEHAGFAEWCLDNGVNAVIALPSFYKGKFIKCGMVNVVTCPAVYREVTCENCMLCAQDRVERKIAIGFPAHGTKKKAIDRVIRECTDTH